MSAEEGGGQDGGGGTIVRAPKRVSGMMFGTQSKYPKWEPQIESVMGWEWTAVPGTSVANESELRFQMTTARGIHTRFPTKCFYFKILTTYRNPGYVQNGEGAERLERLSTQAVQGRAPPHYIDPDVGLFWTVFEKMEVMVDGVVVTWRGPHASGTYHAFYQKLERSFLPRGERTRVCDVKERARTTKDIEYIVANGGDTTPAFKAMAATLDHDTNDPEAAHEITALSSVDALWPFGRRDRNLNRLAGRTDDLTNSLLPPQTVVEVRLTKRNPSHAYVQCDATRLTDAAVFTHTPAPLGNADDAVNRGAVPTSISLVDFKILVQSVKLKDSIPRNRLKFYHDVVGMRHRLIPPGVDAATLTFAIERGTRFAYVVACYSHQLNYQANQNKNMVARFPALTNLESVKFVLGETPLISAEPINGLRSGPTATPASYQVFSYLSERRLFDEPFLRFRPTGVHDNCYLAGIMPLDFTLLDEKQLDSELKIHLKFSDQMSPQNAVVFCATVSEAVWHHDVATKEWTFELVAGKK